MSRTRSRGFTLVELMIVIAIIGILSSVAVVGFMRFERRARQAEVKANLKSVFTAQSAYRSEKETYSAQFTEIGFEPERGNRYAYYLGTSRAEERRGSSAVIPSDGADLIEVDTFRFAGPVAPGFSGTPVGTVGASKDAFTATAAANLDRDAVIDSWMITSLTQAHTAACGSGDPVVIAGTPYNETDDVTCD